jgi:hypothetical protein
MASEHLSAQAALQEVQAAHPRAFPNDGFRRQLSLFEQSGCGCQPIRVRPMSACQHVLHRPAACWRQLAWPRRNSLCIHPPDFKEPSALRAFGALISLMRALLVRQV